LIQRRRKNILSIYNAPEGLAKGKGRKTVSRTSARRLRLLSSPDMLPLVRHLRTPSPVRHLRTPIILTNMEGIEREGLFALQHAPELDTPSSTQSPALTEKKKDKGKTKALLIVEPSSATVKRKPKGSSQQLQWQAAVDEAKAKAAVSASTPGAGPSAPMPPRLILKRPEAVAAEMKVAEKREEEKLKVEERKEEKRKAVERRETEKLAKKAVAKSRWDAADLTEQEWKAYGEAANPIKALLVSDEEGEKAVQRIAHLVGMRAVEELWEDRQARTEKLPTPRVGPP